MRIFSLLVLLLISPKIVTADSGNDLVACNGFDCNFCTAVQTVANVTNWITVIGAIIAGLIIMYGGWTMMSAGANESGHAKGKEFVTNGIIGVVVLFSATALITIILASIMKQPITPGSFFSGYECASFTNTDTNLNPSSLKNYEPAPTDNSPIDASGNINTAVSAGGTSREDCVNGNGTWIQGSIKDNLLSRCRGGSLDDNTNPNAYETYDTPSCPGGVVKAGVCYDDDYDSIYDTSTVEGCRNAGHTWSNINGGCLYDNPGPNVDSNAGGLNNPGGTQGESPTLPGTDDSTNVTNPSDLPPVMVEYNEDNEYVLEGDVTVGMCLGRPGARYENGKCILDASDPLVASSNREETVVNNPMGSDGYWCVFCEDEKAECLNRSPRARIVNEGSLGFTCIY